MCSTGQGVEAWLFNLTTSKLQPAESHMLLLGRETSVESGLWIALAFPATDDDQGERRKHNEEPHDREFEPPIFRLHKKALLIAHFLSALALEHASSISRPWITEAHD
jgi:hypothetical protein